MHRMAATENGHLVDIAEPIFERQGAGQDVVLFCRGLAVASFRKGDSIGRDVAIATLIRVGRGLKTDAIASYATRATAGFATCGSAWRRVASTAWWKGRVEDLSVSWSVPKRSACARCARWA